MILYACFSPSARYLSHTFATGHFPHRDVINAYTPLLSTITTHKCYSGIFPEFFPCGYTANIFNSGMQFSGMSVLVIYNTKRLKIKYKTVFYFLIFSLVYFWQTYMNCDLKKYLYFLNF